MELDRTDNATPMTKRGPAVTVEFEYHWPVDLRVYKHDLVFHRFGVRGNFQMLQLSVG